MSGHNPKIIPNHTAFAKLLVVLQQKTPNAPQQKSHEKSGGRGNCPVKMHSSSACVAKQKEDNDTFRYLLLLIQYAQFCLT